MVRQAQGIIHGTTIELKENPGPAEGAEIEVSLLPLRVAGGPGPGVASGRLPAAGILARLPPKVEEEIEAIIRERKKGVVREIPR